MAALAASPASPPLDAAVSAERPASFHGRQSTFAPDASVAIRATAGQNAQHEDDSGAIALKAHAPVTNPQPPFRVGSRELHHVARRCVAGQPIECLDDASSYRRVEALEVTSRAAGEDPAAQANSRRISSAETTSPRAA